MQLKVWNGLGPYDYETITLWKGDRKDLAPLPIPQPSREILKVTKLQDLLRTRMIEAMYIWPLPSGEKAPEPTITSPRQNKPRRGQLYFDYEVASACSASAASRPANGRPFEYFGDLAISSNRQRNPRSEAACSSPKQLPSISSRRR